MKSKRQELCRLAWANFYDQVSHKAKLQINRSVQAPATFRIHPLIRDQVGI